MAKWFDIAAAVFTFGAAVFWFWSSYGDLPTISAYWGYTPPADPFYVALKFSARMNTIAAFLSGLSALSLFGGIVARKLA
jgi:hypothetical protein